MSVILIAPEAYRAVLGFKEALSASIVPFGDRSSDNELSNFTQHRVVKQTCCTCRSPTSSSSLFFGVFFLVWCWHDNVVVLL